MIVPSDLYNLLETQRFLDIRRRRLYRYLELDLLDDNDSSYEMSLIDNEFQISNSNNKIEKIEKIEEELSQDFNKNDTAFQTFLE